MVKRKQKYEKLEDSLLKDFCYMYVVYTSVLMYAIILTHLGTKVKMDKLEDKFIAGGWVPPFLSLPNKKRKQSKSCVAVLRQERTAVAPYKETKKQYYCVLFHA